MSHSHGMAGIRIGFIGGAPEVIQPILFLKSSLTRINVSIVAQYAALYALQDKAYLSKCDRVLRDNFKRLSKIISDNAKLNFLVLPTHGYFTSIDTAQIKASCQELTIALLKRKCAVYPSDGLGDYKPTTYLRINYSTPYKKHFDWLERVLPDAIEEAESRVYRQAVLNFYLSIKTKRARTIVQQIKAM